MVKIENLSFSYDKNTVVLDQFNLELKQGEVVAIKGPSGCGKSTILRLIAGLEKSDSGNIYIDDKRVNDVPTHKRNVGFVFQSLAIFPHLTVYDNIAFGLVNMSKKEKDYLVREIAEKVEVIDMLERYPHEISGGQKQRVAIARSLVVRPKVLLLDEPFTALDEDLKETVRADMKKILTTFNITTILVTHDINDAYGLNARVIHFGTK